MNSLARNLSLFLSNQKQSLTIREIFDGKLTGNYDWTELISYELQIATRWTYNRRGTVYSETTGINQARSEPFLLIESQKRVFYGQSFKFWNKDLRVSP